jgi:O-acetylserine/cysteine efflux transporter
MKLRDLMILMLICLVWAFNLVSGAKGMQQFSPLLFTLLRFALLLTLTLPFLRWPPPGQWKQLISAALSIGSAHFIFLFWALQRSSDVSTVAIAMQTYVPMAVLLAVLILGESIGWRTVLAIALAFAGVVILSFDPHVLSQPDALILALLAGFFQALGSVYIRGIVGVSAFSFLAWTAIVSIPPLLALTLLLESGQVESMLNADPLHWGSIIFSVIGASIIGHGLFFYMAQRHPISSITPYLLMTPLFAVLFGVLVWGDTPGWRLLLGGSLILLGILAINLRARQKAQKILR